MTILATRNGNDDDNDDDVKMMNDDDISTLDYILIVDAFHE